MVRKYSEYYCSLWMSKRMHILTDFGMLGLVDNSSEHNIHAAISIKVVPKRLSGKVEYEREMLAGNR
jgi:hypothetical protein